MYIYIYICIYRYIDWSCRIHFAMQNIKLFDCLIVVQQIMGYR